MLSTALFRVEKWVISPLAFKKHPWELERVVTLVVAGSVSHRLLWAQGLRRTMAAAMKRDLEGCCFIGEAHY